MRPTRYWRSEDGVKIPHHSERNARNDWDDKYYDQLVATHAGGNSHAFKHVKIPLDANFIGHSDEPFTGARNRTGFYTRMLHGGDSVPPIAVKEAAGGYEVIDGHSRIRASKAAGKDDIGAYVLISRSNEPVMKFESHTSIDEPVAQNPIQVKHYSLKSGLKKLHPKHQGTGLAGPEKNRSKRIPRIYLYTREGTPEAHVSGGHLYHGELPAGTQLYNMGEDPLDLMAPKWQPTEDGMMYEPADLDEVERHLYDLGYHGYHNYGVKDAIAYFHALPVQQQKSERMAKSDIGGMLSRIRLVRQTCDRRVRGAKNPTHICHMVAPAVAHTTGLHHVMGVYRGPEVDAYSEGDGNYYHEWNVHDDGTIVDATADQFGDDSVRIIPPNDPRSGWYEATTINHTPSSVVKSEAGLHHLWNPGSRDPLTVAHPHDNVVWYEYLPEDLEKGKKDGHFIPDLLKTPEAQTGLITKWQDPNSRIASTYNNATQLASNPALTPENQRELLDVSLEGVRYPVLEGLAANPNLDPAIGRELAASPDEHVRIQFARWAAPAQPLARSEDHTEYDTEAGLDPEFKQWFGNSKTTGFQGKPMKFYRGTAKPGMKGKLPTMSFVEHPDVASVYSATPDMDGGASIGHGATVHPVHIKMENPIYLQEHQTRFSDVLMALKYGQPNGITHDEAVKMLNHMCNRTRGVKVKLPPFQYRYSKYPWVEPHDRDPDEYEEGEEALDPDFDPEDEEFSLTQYPISRFRDAFEYEHGFENVMAEASRLKADTYAYIDTPRFAEVAKRLGHDGVIHGDVFNAKGAMNDVLDKDPDEIDGLEEERGLEDWDWTHQTYRPFDISQVRSIFHGAGKPELSRPSLVPWLNKAEALLKMAIRDVKPGTPLDPQDISLDEFTNNPVATHGYDYSHLITSPLLRHKYGMHVYPSRDGLNVRVFHKGSGRSLGSLVGMIDRHDGIKVIDPTFTHIEPELRGKGLGKAMYEAAFAHAYHHHNVRGVIGGEHSTMAHGVHQALSEKHGFEGYNPVSRIPRGDGYTGAFDDAFGDYEYRIQ